MKRLAVLLLGAFLLAGCSRGPTVNSFGPRATGNPNPGAKGTDEDNPNGLPGTGKPVTPPPR
jgi:PBP1b-binding outer membrane lipoprotein LpoB